MSDLPSGLILNLRQVLEAILFGSWPGGSDAGIRERVTGAA